MANVTTPSVLKPGVDAGDVRKAFREQARQDDQHHRQGDLRRRERDPEPRRPAAAGRLAGLGFQRRQHVGACGMQRREQADGDARGNRQHRRHDEGGRVQVRRHSVGSSDRTSPIVQRATRRLATAATSARTEDSVRS